MGLPREGFMLVREAEEIIGGRLSYTSKMPVPSFGLPAKACITGSILRKIEGSVCQKCYALKGLYQFPNVGVAQYKRLDALKHPRWVDAMTMLISRTETAWFRWHDSGDLQGLGHLTNLAEIAVRMPHVKFWLPTRERGMVRDYHKVAGRFPKNLIVRVSTTMVGDAPPAGFEHTSGVVKKGATCPAHLQGNVCGDCRKCWNPRIKNVTYHLH